MSPTLEGISKMRRQNVPSQKHGDGCPHEIVFSLTFVIMLAPDPI